MATLEDNTRSCACETRRALIAALFTTAVAGPAVADTLLTPLPPIPVESPWGDSERFISWLSPSGAGAVAAARGALASPDDVQAITLSPEGKLRIHLPAGVVVSAQGVEFL